MIAIDQLIRSSRKTVSLVVTPEGKLVVRAPLRLSKARIDELIARKTDWIARHQAKARSAGMSLPDRRQASPPRRRFSAEIYLNQRFSFIPICLPVSIPFGKCILRDPSGFGDESLTKLPSSGLQAQYSEASIQNQNPFASNALPHSGSWLLNSEYCSCNTFLMAGLVIGATPSTLTCARLA